MWMRTHANTCTNASARDGDYELTAYRLADYNKQRIQQNIQQQITNTKKRYEKVFILPYGYCAFRRIVPAG